MLSFILGFIIGAVTEFIALLIIAHEVQKKRDKEILHLQRLDKEAKEHMSDFLHLENWDSVRNLTEEERDKYFAEFYKANNTNMTDLQNALRSDNND